MVLSGDGKRKKVVVRQSIIMPKWAAALKNQGRRSFMPKYQRRPNYLLKQAAFWREPLCHYSILCMNTNL